MASISREMPGVASTAAITGGPGRADAELAKALDLGVERIHVESPYELTWLAELADVRGREVDVFLRLNLAGDTVQA